MFEGTQRRETLWSAASLQCDGLIDVSVKAERDKTAFQLRYSVVGGMVSMGNGYWLLVVEALGC